MQVIAYQQTDGSVAVVYPAPGWPMKFIGMKDVPASVPYILVDDSTLSAPLDFSKPAGVGDPNFGEGTGWGVAAYNSDGTITLVNTVTKETKLFNPGITSADIAP